CQSIFSNIFIRMKYFMKIMSLQSIMIKKSDLNVAMSLMGGNILEFYCFILIPLSSKSLAQHFLHGYKGEIASTIIFLISFIGYISRPVGAILLGHIADRYGRKNVVIKSILITSILTSIIAIIPSSSVIGIAAPVSLIIIRFLQGFCVSGEE